MPIQSDSESYIKALRRGVSDIYKQGGRRLRARWKKTQKLPIMTQMKKPHKHGAPPKVPSFN